MASITYEFYDAETGFRATCLIEEVDGTLVFTIDVDESTGTVADLRALFFDMNRDDQAFLDSLSVTGDDVSDQMFKTDSVTNLGQGTTVNGEVVQEVGEFDAGVEIGSAGTQGDDDIQWTQFTLSSSLEPLTLDMLMSVDTALRATSVGDIDGPRNGSLKLVGDTTTGIVSGYYFYDTDGNDIDNAGDEGVAGKWVTLYEADGVTRATDIDGNLVAAVQTGANGDYYFDNLASGDYVVHFEDSGAEGREFVARDVGTDDAVDSDVDPLTGMTGLVTVVAGLETTDVDAGVKALPEAPPPPPASISGRYFEDTNRNSIDDGEVGIAGALVTLLDADGNAVATTTTAGDGSYSFADLDAGSYSVEFAPTPGMSFAARDTGADDSIDSDVDPATGRTGAITVEAGQDATDVDAGVQPPPASISGRYFDDANRNDVDDAEAGIAGALVTLRDGNGTVVATTTTAADGGYSFANLVAGAYIVEFEPVPGMMFSARDVGGDDSIDSDVGVTTGRTDTIVVVAGEDRIDVDAGVKAPPASISGRYFHDANRNDLDDGEAGIAGRTVTLFDAEGAAVATTVTAADGSYSFGDLAAGTYSVGFQPVTGMVFSAQDAGDDAIDSDADAAGRTAPVTVAAGQDLGDVDAGVQAAPASLSGRYFDDANANGLDDGEAGIAGMTVTLLDQGGTAVATTLTAADGSYSFGDLEAGSYTVQFQPVEAREFTAQNAGDDAIDSDVDATGITGTIVVTAGQDVIDVDAGVRAPGGDEPGGGDESYDLTGTIRTGSNSLTVIMDASWATYDFFMGIPPEDLNADGLQNVIDAMLAEVVKESWALAADQRIDLILAGDMGVIGQIAVQAGDLRDLDPHDPADAAALQALFAPVFNLPAGLPEDVDFAAALDAALATIQDAYGATGASNDQVILMSTSDGVDFTGTPYGGDAAASAEALVTAVDAEIDHVLIEPFFTTYTVVDAIDAADGDGDGITEVFSADPFLAGQIDPSPALTEASVVGLLVEGERIEFRSDADGDGVPDPSDGDGLIEIALSGIAQDPLAGVSIELDTTGDGIADQVVAATVTQQGDAYHFDLDLSTLIV